MDQGLVTNPKDLARMQQELVSLDRRISELEDTELEVMEQLEDAQAEHARLSRPARRDRRPRRGAWSSSRDAGAGDVDPRGRVRDRRAQGRPPTGVPADLLALYEKVRAQKGGVGAAILRARQCTGCSLSSTPPTSA